MASTSALIAWDNLGPGYMQWCSLSSQKVIDTVNTPTRGSIDTGRPMLIHLSTGWIGDILGIVLSNSVLCVMTVPERGSFLPVHNKQNLFCSVSDWVKSHVCQWLWISVFAQLAISLCCLLVMPSVQELLVGGVVGCLCHKWVHSRSSGCHKHHGKELPLLCHSLKLWLTSNVAAGWVHWLAQPCLICNCGRRS